MRLITTLLAGGLTFAALSGGCYQTFPGQGVFNDYRSYVPMTAKSVGTGEGSVSYVATEPATVYLIDHNRYDNLNPDKKDNKHYAPHVIGSYLLQTGQAVSVDGASQTITLGGTGISTPTVFKNPNLSSDNSYELRADSQTPEK